MSFVSAPSSGLSVIGHVTCICPIKFIRYWSRHFYQPHHQVYQLLVMTLVSAPSSGLSVTGHDTCICHIINIILFWSWHFYLSGHYQVYPLLHGHDTFICPAIISFIRYWSWHFYLPHHWSSLSVTGHVLIMHLAGRLDWLVVGWNWKHLRLTKETDLNVYQSIPVLRPPPPLPPLPVPKHQSGTARTSADSSPIMTSRTGSRLHSLTPCLVVAIITVKHLTPSGLNT